FCKKIVRIVIQYFILLFYKKFRKADNLDYKTGDIVLPLADIHFDIMDIPLPADTYDWVICYPSAVRNFDFTLPAKNQISFLPP
ncbi:MAG: hypothetical protein M0P32_03615, partial [Bacteroidales bacterium]|nr:hypothetical protein [Bacteroidales bacterium]